MSLPALRFEPVLAPNTPELDADDIEDQHAFGKILNDAHAARRLRRRQRKEGADRAEGEEDGSSVASHDTGLSLSRALDGADVFSRSDGWRRAVRASSRTSTLRPRRRTRSGRRGSACAEGASSEAYMLARRRSSFNGPTVVAFSRINAPRL